jgi:hypothetical protein
MTRLPQLLAQDDFRHGPGGWAAELEHGGQLTVRQGVLEIEAPGGASLWWRQPFPGPHEIAFTAVPVAEGGPHDRVSDLNAFWGAQDARSPGDLFATRRSGAFAEYDHLTCYYVGLGGNSNSTTRFRRYVGVPGERPLLGERAEPLLEPNRPYRIRLVMAGGRAEYWCDDRMLFDAPDPCAGGWFAFRTTAGRFRLTGFHVLAR